jgi:single-strand DNA-binding protein
MQSLNKVQIIGNLGQDPETRYTPSGHQTTTISVATTEKWKDKATGELKEKTEWHRVVFFGRLAEVAVQYLKKGRPVYVEGRLNTHKWVDKDKIDRHITQINASDMILLGNKPADGGSAPPAAAASQPNSAASHFDDMPDDIPF